MNSNTSLISFSNKEILLANELALNDYEDACIAASAINSGFKYLVTRDKNGFKGIPLKILTPNLAKNLFQKSQT